MTDQAIFGYCRFGYTKFGIYRPRFDAVVRRVEATKPRTFQEIIRKLEG